MAAKKNLTPAELGEQAARQDAILLNLSKAIRHMEKARAIFEGLATLTGWQEGKGDFQHYANDLSEMLSSDCGEAGAEALLKLLKKQFN